MKKAIVVFKIVLVTIFAGCNKDDSGPAAISIPEPTPQPQNQVPGSFALLAPKNDVQDESPVPFFSWEQATDSDGDAVAYDVYLDTKSNPEYSIANDLSTTSYTIPDTMALSLAQEYYWKVVAKDGKGGETTSSIFTFKVQNLNDPERISSKGFIPRDRHASVVYNGAMWVIGGFYQGLTLDNSSSSTDGRQWNTGISQADERFTGRYFHSAIAHDDRIWIAGGLADDFLNDVWTTTNGTQWQKIDQIQPYVKRAEHTFTYHNGKMWVIGGNNGDGKLGDVWNSADGANWELVSEETPFNKRNFHQTVSFQGKLWVIGGLKQDENTEGFSNDIWSSVDGISWVEENSNAEFSPRGFHKALVFDDKIWIIGGAGGQDNFNDIWYSENGKEWVEATPKNMFQMKNQFTALFHNNKIWILGGGGTSEVWAIDYHFFTN